MRIETTVQWLAGLLAYASLGVVLYDVRRGTQQQARRTVGPSSSWLHSWWFYLASSFQQVLAHSFSKIINSSQADPMPSSAIQCTQD